MITIIPKTNQEAFDLAVKHIYTMNGQATDPTTGACVYRGDQVSTSKVRCAIGAMIPDEQYDPSIEGASVSTLNYDPDHKVLDVGDVNESLLQQLQAAHDGNGYWSLGRPNVRMAITLGAIAGRFGLDMLDLDRRAYELAHAQGLDR